MIEMPLSQSEPVALPDRSSGPVARSVAGHALLVAVMIASQVLVVFVPAVVFHCALRNGRRSAAWAAATAAVALYAVFALGTPRPEGQPYLALMDVAFIALAVVLPSLVALPLVERGEPFGRVLMVLLIGSTIGLAATESGFRSLLAASPFAEYVAQINQQNAQMVELYRKEGVPTEGLRKWLDGMTFVLPGILLVTLTLMFTLSLLMLGRLKAWREHAASRGGALYGAYLFRNFSLPEWVLFAFIAGGLTPLVSGLMQKVAANTLVVVAFLYLLQGLAIFRFVLAAAGASGIAAIAGWMLLVFLVLTGIGLLLLPLAGLFDPFFDFRHFKKRKDDSHESHSD